MENRVKHFYEFGEFRLDPAERLLRRRGETVALTPKAFDVLLALVEDAGHLLEKETLLKTVWPDTFVEDNNLADNISRLRKTLGEGDNWQKYIETVPKRGYRFVAEVTKQGIEGEPEQGSIARPSRRFRIALIAASLAPVFIGSALWLDFWVKKRAEVYRLEVRGDFYASKWTEPEIRKGIEYYNRAIALDPHSAASYAGLAVGWNFLSDLHAPPREAMPKSKAAALKALAIEETMANAHVSLGVAKMQYDWDWAGAEQDFQRAIALDPKHRPAHRLYGWYLIAMGRFDDAKAVLKRTLEADPLDDSNMWELGLAFYFAGQYDEAVEQSRRAIGVEPTSYWPHMLLGWAYEQQGKVGEAITQFNEAVRLNDNPQVVASLAHMYGKSGQREEAERVISGLLETSKRRYVSPYDIAAAYAGLGDKEQTLAWLERAYEERCGWLAWWLKVEPRFDAVRPDARFRDLLRRVGHER